ncbi:MAG TPA: hypothetical protein VGE38_16680 [Nocardioides sp.]|uniref:hypothetical protein n=1 Tax=Nocardioides sp. TaxID=35761 RepID=UPI002EDAC9DB
MFNRKKQAPIRRLYRGQGAHEDVREFLDRRIIEELQGIKLALRQQQITTAHLSRVVEQATGYEHPEHARKRAIDALLAQEGEG